MIKEKRYRGDTTPYVVKVVDENGDPVDVTNWSFKLTGSKKENPDSITDQIFSIPGNVTSGVDGEVTFTFLESDVDVVGEVYVDVESQDGEGFIETLDKGVFVFRQDITK